MRSIQSSILVLAAALLMARATSAGVAFPDPPGGWTYHFNGDKREPGGGSDFDALDGTWSHNNGSDQWDGSEIGGPFSTGGFLIGNGPGGVNVLTEGGMSFLRIQDTGDPRDYGYPDPSNRKIYFTHSMTAHGAADSQMQDGVTLSFRARIPTAAKATGPLDPWHRDGQQAGGVLPYPAGGDGYVTANGGKGNFVIRELAGGSLGGSIAFSLTQTSDTTGGALTPTANFAGLTMNEFNGNTVNNNVNFGQGSATNVIALDPTDWHEFWVVLKKDPANIGTHVAYIYVDGNLTPTVFKMTAGGSDGSADGTDTYLAMGSTATGQNSALDVDFVAYKLGAVFPPGFVDPPGGWTYRFEGDKREPGTGGTDFDALDGAWNHNNGSDQWDGSEIGGTFSTGGYLVGNGPGGVNVLSEPSVTYLRIQDTGDPRDYAYPDPSNRKIYFGHSTTALGGTDVQMDEGITLSFRARIPTASKAADPLDPWHRDGQQAAGVRSYPAAGDGYVTSDGGKGNFVIKQAGGGAIAFSLTETNDTTGGALTPSANFSGLTMNEFNGNQLSGNVNFGQGTGTNVIALDPTDWHTFWIVLKKDLANIGTHQAYIYVDGSLTPTVFKMTGGTGAETEYGGLTYLAMGMTATPQNAALDVDFVAYKLGAFFPGGALDNLPPELLNISPEYGKPFHSAAAGISVEATTQGINTLPPARAKLTLNGQDVSNGLTVSGTPQARTITYTSLQPNTIYTGTLIVSDQDGRSDTNKFFFDTFVEAQTTVIEAEDYNFSSGQFIDAPAAGAYAGQAGTLGVDFLDTTQSSVGVYREADPVDNQATADSAREKFTSGGLSDYQIGLIGRGEWWNYTRTLASGKFYAYLRCAATAAQDARLDRVTGDTTQPNQATQFLGTFRVPRTGNLNSFDYAVLSDLQGNPVALPLAGKTTLRLTAASAGNNLALNYLVLAPAPSGVPTGPAVSALPAPAATGVLPDAAVEAAIYDGSSPVDKASVKLRVDGTDVNATIDKTGGITQVKYVPAVMWAANSAHTVNLSFNDGTPRSFDWGFTMAAYQLLTPAMKVADAQTPGFVWRMFQNEANQDTTTQRAEDALAGRLKDGSGQPLQNLANPDITGPASGPGTPAAPGNGTMTFNIPSVINVSQTEGTAFGNFTPDEQMPGIPGLNNITDGIAAEITAFIELPRGLINMGVNSDDGFRTTAGFLKDNPLVLGEFNGGRGAADTLFQFAVQEAGLYAFRTLWEEGGGDASIEWFIVNADGSRVLINDIANGGARAFQEGTVPNRPIENVILTIRLNAAGQVVLEWIAGTLQAADAVTGTYQDVTGVQSPFVTAPAGAQKFYRVRVGEPPSRH